MSAALQRGKLRQLLMSAKYIIGLMSQTVHVRRAYIGLLIYCYWSSLFDVFDTSYFWTIKHVFYVIEEDIIYSTSQMVWVYISIHICSLAVA